MPARGFSAFLIHYWVARSDHKRITPSPGHSCVSTLLSFAGLSVGKRRLLRRPSPSCSWRFPCTGRVARSLCPKWTKAPSFIGLPLCRVFRSEERRVGQECRVSVVYVC